MKRIITATFAVALAACWLGAASAADVKEKAVETKDTIKEKATEAKDTVSEKATEVKDKIKAKMHRNGRSAHEDVMTAQRSLKEQGFDPGPIDGVVGDRTRAAIANYQRDHNMKVTRQLDRKTMAALRKAEAPNASPSTTDTQPATPPPVQK